MTKVIVDDEEIYSTIRDYVDRAKDVDDLKLRLEEGVVPVLSLNGGDEVFNRECSWHGIIDNDTTWVNIFNVTGSGLCVGAGYYTQNNTPTVEINIIVDGTNEETHIFPTSGSNPAYFWLGIMRKFSSALNVRARLSGVGTVYYYGSALID